MLNLILGVVWLCTAASILGYEFVNGPSGLRIRGLDVSAGWLFLLLGLYNFVRWYSSRANRAEQEALRLAHERRLRQTRYRERPIEPDPTFDFSDKPAPPATNFMEPPLSPPREPGKDQ